MKRRLLAGRAAAVPTLVTALAMTLGQACGGGAPESTAVDEAASTSASERRPAVRPAGLPPRRPDPAAVALAERHLGPSARRESCGPYRLWTDVTEPSILALCERLAAPLDAVYRARLGAAPRGEPSEGIFLFADLAGYRAFAAAHGRTRTGYAGYASPADGFVALYVPAGRDELATTLAHELTHLVHRRTLGPDLPPWLSEGLAEAIGDPASEAGLGSLTGRTGAEVAVRRLATAYREGRAGPLERLVTLGRGEFDRGVVSFDYEQSALLARFLLLDPELGGRFRRYLGALAAGEGYSPEALASALGGSWTELDRRFRTWLEAG